MRNIFSPSLVVNTCNTLQPVCDGHRTYDCTTVVANLLFFGSNCSFEVYIYIDRQFEDIFTKGRHSAVRLAIRKTWQIFKLVVKT